MSGRLSWSFEGLPLRDSNRQGMPGIRPAQEPFAQPRSAIATWKLEDDDHISLLEVVKNAKPTTLIGVSGQAGAFTEEVIRTMAASVERPVIFPLSNPTSRSEATPEDLLKWTEGRALIGTGSPFAAVNWNGRQVPIDQTNNSIVCASRSCVATAGGVNPVAPCRTLRCTTGRSAATREPFQRRT